MKKYYLFALALLAASNVFAQANTWIIDANGSVDNQQFKPASGYGGDPISLTGWSANAAVGRHVSEHFVVGLQGGYGQQEQMNYYSYSAANGTIYQQNKIRMSQWHFGVYGRLTYTITPWMFVYSQLSVSKYGRDYKTIDVTQNNYSYAFFTEQPNLPEGNGISISAFPAVGFNIIHGFGLHLDVGGINYEQFNALGDKYSHINVNFGQQFSIGIHKIIGWKRIVAHSNN